MAQQVHVDISVFGDKQLQRALKALPINVEKKVVRQALRKAAKPVLDTAKSLVPVKTGALKKSLKLRALRKQKRGQFGVQVMTGTREQLGIAADDPYYYPMAVEVGTAKAPAHPFMRPALDQNREATYRLVAELVRTGITRATVELGGKASG